MCEEARVKFAENGQKKKDVKFFKSAAHSEKIRKKISDRLESCERRVICSRNDYMLAVETANVHLERHKDIDLPKLMQASGGQGAEGG